MAKKKPKPTLGRKTSVRQAEGSPTHTATTATPRAPEQRPTARHATKKDTVVALLSQAEGATLDEITAVTGWQAHSIRGFISGTVRKKLGLTVELVRRKDGTSGYRALAPGY